MKKLFLIAACFMFNACREYSPELKDGKSIVSTINGSDNPQYKYEVTFYNRPGFTCVYTNFPYRIGDTIEFSKW